MFIMYFFILIFSFIWFHFIFLYTKNWIQILKNVYFSKERIYQMAYEIDIFSSKPEFFFKG